MAGLDSKHDSCDSSDESLVEVIDLTLDTDDERDVASDEDERDVMTEM